MITEMNTWLFVSNVMFKYSNTLVYCCRLFCFTFLVAVDYTPPVVSSCPSDQETTVNAEPTELDWDEPTAYTTDGDDIYMTSNFPEGKMFPEGLTTVTYRFADIFENVGICEFIVNVTIGEIRSIIHLSFHVLFNES